MEKKNGKRSILKIFSEFIKEISIVLAGITFILAFVFGITIDQIRDWIQSVFNAESAIQFISTYKIHLSVLMALLFFGTIFWIIKKNKNLENTVISEKDIKNTDPLSIYLSDISSISSFLPFGDYSTPDAALSDQEKPITLDDVWTELHVSVEPSELGTDVKNKAEEYIFEDYVTSENRLNSEEGPLRLILLGDPGSGKSSCLARLVLKYCQEIEENKYENTLLPISVRIDQVDLSQDNPIQAICKGINFDEEQQKGLQLKFSEAAMSGRVIFLIDGLDELAENDKGKAANFLEKIVSDFPLSKVLATCRTDDFHDSPDYSVLRNFNICTLQPYSLNDVLNYINRWYSAFGKKQSFSAARRERSIERLDYAMRADDTLLGLARTPLLTALICLVHALRSELPRTRSLLYYEGIYLLLTWRGVDDGSRSSPTEVMSFVSDIAYEAHVLGEKDDGSGRYGISEGEIGQIIDARIAQEFAHTSSDQLSIRERTASLMRQILNSNSLIVETSSNKYKFSHRAFQEFLAGQYFAKGNKIEEVVNRANALHWAEPLRLLANYSPVTGGNLFYVLFLCSAIFRSRKDVLSRCLVGEMLCEIGASVISSKDYGYVMDEAPKAEEREDANITTGLWPLVRDNIYKFAESAELENDHELRLRLFRTLAELGDPRLSHPDGTILSVSDQIVRMERRIVSIGHLAESDYLKNRLNSANALKSYPIRKVFVNDFAMNRYLVTNQDFKRFMAAGGYKDEHYWPSESGRSWLRGDSGFQNKLFEGWLETVERDYKREISDEMMNVDSLREAASQVLAARQKPYYWDNPRFCIATAPVVGINLWEAAAYCNWLTEELRNSQQIEPNEMITVPTEFEWERAARDCNESGEYPWGDKWDEGRGHVNHGALDLSNAAPVGMFPKGGCPDGPMDLCGNVWEWTTSSASNWDNPSVRNICFDNTFDDIVVRGSSWYNSHELARSGIRQCDRLYNIYFDLGFRWVLINEEEHEHEKFV